nr:hypothetical protein [Tanacetum cinerariifolium]
MASFDYRLNPRFAIKECSSCGALYTRDCSYSKGSVEDKKLEEDLVTYIKYFQDTSESSDDGTNVVNDPRETVVVKQDHGVNPPHIDKCCCECGEALDGIYCQECIYALGTTKNKPEDLQELFRELSNDVQNIHEELAEYINTPGWNRPAFYDDDDDDDMDYTIAITPVLSNEEPVNSL